MSSKTMFRRTLVGAAIVASALAVTAMPAGASSAVVSSGALRDLAPTAENATDGARATVVAVAGREGTFVMLVVTGLDRSAAGTTFGAHVHVGPCVAGDGAAAGPHYNIGAPASEDTEVWLDFTVRRSGTALAQTVVPFVIPAGAARSVVIHAMATDHAGAAGSRQACLPVNF